MNYTVELKNCSNLRLFSYLNHSMTTWEKFFTRDRYGSVFSITYEQNNIPSNDTTHEQNIIFRQLFASHVSWKMQSNDNYSYFTGFNTNLKPAAKKQHNPASWIFFSEETSFLTPAEKRFKLYDGVETFVMFIGHPRSRHSLVAAILDAHPEIIISHEYSVLENWNEYRRLKQKNMQKYKLFFEIHNLSTEQSMFGLRGETNLSRYSYYIPGLWQGGYEKQIKVSTNFSTVFWSRQLGLVTQYTKHERPCLTTFPDTKNRVENTMRSEVLLTNYEAKH